MKLKLQIETQEEECKKHKSELEKVEKKVDEIMNEMQRMETRNNKNKFVHIWVICYFLDLIDVANSSHFIQYGHFSYG